MEIEELEEGERILFNDRKEPLEVKSVVRDDGAEAEVEGPGGALYVLYEDGGTPLVARKGNRRYSSYLEQLRRTGKWKRDGEEWSHTVTGASISVEEDSGLFRVEVEGFKPSDEQPRYGFTSRGSAVEYAEKVVQKNPEGKGDEDG